MYVCLCKVCIMWSAGIVIYCYVLYVLYVLCVSVFRTAKTTSHLLSRPIDIDIAVGSLTCYGAVLCLHPPLPEVEVWLRDKSDDNWPWIVQHCVSLLQTKCKWNHVT